MSTPASETSFETLYAEIERLPQHVTGEILEPGRVRTMLRPSAAHRRAARILGDTLKARDLNFGGVGWWLEAEAEVRLPEDRLVVPDWAGWQVETMPQFILQNPIAVVHAWCAEVLSPSNGRDDRLVKTPLYARAGVDWVWLIDPQQRALEVYATSSGQPILVAGGRDDDNVAPPPFALPFSLNALWLEASP